MQQQLSVIQTAYMNRLIKIMNLDQLIDLAQSELVNTKYSVECYSVLINELSNIMDDEPFLQLCMQLEKMKIDNFRAENIKILELANTLMEM